MWTKYIRIRDMYTCQKCGRVYPVGNCRNLGVSHFWGRGRENVRFDDDNCIALCTLPCHDYWGHGEGRKEYEEYMIKRLGQEGFEALMVRAHIRKKRDDNLDRIIIGQLLKEVTWKRSHR